ncbi:AAA family ATPase [Cereibacter changlensis]|uniref:AAA family ATPase n=1 Tax=Cereibacter changlensis TaxID=402884 RepID=A0A4U0YWA1_9RHOB|nr:AAA family ATPase [Cereibacter changlensis]TKA97060.1 AAA family ATPase [Cereibacter changlensis]
MKHLKKEDRDRLEVLAGGVRLAVIQSEHRADELTAELHGEFPWLAPATEVVWRAMRRSVREGWPGFRMPPLLLDGPVGIGKSVWARWLGTLIEAPSLVVEATNQNASFGIVGSQRGWSNAAPGRLMQNILQHLCGNPIVVVEEIEKAGPVHSGKGQSFDLVASLLPLLEPATAGSWNCPFFEVQFDMGWINWVLTTNNRHLLSEPLRSRCTEVRLQQVGVADLVGFARRQGRRRQLSDLSVEAIIAALEHPDTRARRLSLRSVIRLLDRAAELERDPMPI